MKKVFVTIVMMVMSIVSVSAQKNVSVEVTTLNGKQGYFIPADQASVTVAQYMSKKLSSLPHYQAIDVEKQIRQGDKLTIEKLGGKGAEAFGHGIEIFAGVGLMNNTMNKGVFVTPEVGIRYRYDWRWVSVTLGASALSRQYNHEAIEAGKRYFSYGTDLTFHVNLFNLGQSEHVLSVFGQGGYLFGKHRKAIDELDGVSLIHNGSGLTYGGGLEYRWQIHRTGNALTLRAGYKQVPNTYVNDTNHNGMVYAQIGFNIGIKRFRVNNLKKSNRRGE